NELIGHGAKQGRHPLFPLFWRLVMRSRKIARRVTMDMEFTSRQGKISKALRQKTEQGMERIARILGRTVRSSIVFDTERHLHRVEITVRGRAHQFAAEGKATEPEAALRLAISHAEAPSRGPPSTGLGHPNPPQPSYLPMVPGRGRQLQSTHSPRRPPSSSR